jgi:hypothetical protein
VYLGVHLAFFYFFFKKNEYGFEAAAFILFTGVIVSYHLIASYFPELLQIFNKSLLAKFCWAMDVDPDFRF